MVLREREVEEVEVKVKVEVRRKAGFYCRSRSLLIGGGGRVGGRGFLIAGDSIRCRAQR
jgi:hypothetical protein